MSGISIREARREDAPFLARIILLSGRAHVRRGIWEAVLGGPEEEVLDFLREITVTGPPHLFHHSCFIVAEIEGRPVAALGGYDPREKGYDKLRAAVDKVQAGRGRRPEGRGTSARAQRVLSCLPESIEGAWTIDSVATLPDCRRKGIAERLLGKIVEIGKGRGYRKFQVTIYIGNEAAQRAYEKMGFSIGEEKRCSSFMEEIGSPGMASMTMFLD